MRELKQKGKDCKRIDETRMTSQFKFVITNVSFFILMRFGLLAANSDVAFTAPPKSPLYGKHLRVIWVS